MRSSGHRHGDDLHGDATHDVRLMIKREQKIMDAARRMRSSARNNTVRSQCDSQISEAARNIAYLQEQLEKLTVSESSANSPNKNQEVATKSNGTSSNQVQNSANAKITRLDLFRWDKPATMGPRIKLMLQQLEYKTSIEQQYERGTRKLMDLYRQTGDRRSQAEAHANLAESTAKMALLKRSKKRYSDMNLAAVLGTDGEDDSQLIDSGFAVPNVRKPLTGVLRVFVKQVEEVDHTIAWADQVEMWVTMKVENNSAEMARTRATRSSMFEEDFTIPVDKGNEIEFTVYDRSLNGTPSSLSSSSSSSSAPENPVALLWLRISDIAEAIRQIRVERELKQTGWASAARVQELNASGKQPSGPSTGPFTGAAAGASTAAGADASTRSTTPIPSPSSSGVPGSSTDLDTDTVEGWFTLEPAGRIYLRLAFEKTGTNLRKRVRAYEGTPELARLGRHNAIRKREETQQVHGHEFVLHQAYNIVRCSVCGDFTTSFFQCQECKLTCDRKCFSKIVTKCTALMSQDPDEELNHRIPHHFEPTTNMRATWCAQCGFILPLASRRNVRKCTECGIIAHASCTAFVPDLCGMSMEMAAQVVNEITSTRIRQATRSAAVSYNNQTPNERSQGRNHYHTASQVSHASQASSSPSHSPQQQKRVSLNNSSLSPMSAYSGSPTKAYPPPSTSSTSSIPKPYGGKHPQHVVPPPPPPKTAPVRRKQVPSVGQIPDTNLGSSGVPPLSNPINMSTQQPTSSYAATQQHIQHQQPMAASSRQQPLQQQSTTTNTPMYNGPHYTSGTSGPPMSHEAYIADQFDQLSALNGPTGANGIQSLNNPISASLGALENSSVGSSANSSVSTPGYTTAPVSGSTGASAPASARSAPTNLPVTTTTNAPVPVNTTGSSKYSAAPTNDPSMSVNTAGGKSMQGMIESLPPVPQTTSIAPRRKKKVGLDDFSFLAVLGKGNFGKVMLAESKHTGQLYAVKVLKKNFIIENREVESTRSEKRVFLIANRERHPFLINLFACFQTENRIYFVMDYVSGGDLMFHIQQRMFGTKRAQFYAAEVLLALKHFHDNNVIYRDLKLDNILLSLDGHIKVADYGLCKENMGYGSTTGTFCGTPDFIAPEILLDQKYGRSVDWWALGVLMYQMLLGKSPFLGNDEDEIYDAILSDEPLYPIHMPRDSVSILQQLLTRDPSKRLGSGPTDAQEIMAHPYFADINFDSLLNLKVEPPYKPEIDSPTDVRYFERDFTSEIPALTPMNSMLTQDMQEEFKGFSYSLGDTI